MSDFNVDNSSPITPTSSAALPPKRNKKRLRVITSLIVLALLVIGGLSAFLLFQQNQDTRNQASVAGGLITAKLQPANNQTCTSGQTCEIDVVLNTRDSNIDALQLKINFDQNSSGAVSDVAFIQSIREAHTSGNDAVINKGDKSGSCVAQPGFASDKMLRYCSRDTDCPENHYCNINVATADARPGLTLSSNTVSNSELVLVWTLSDPSFPFNTNGQDQVLGRILFKVNGANVAVSQVNLTIDQTFSKATLYKTGQDSLDTPSPLALQITPDQTSQLACKNDSGCPVNQYCYFEPIPSGVSTLRAVSYCKDRESNNTQVTCRVDADCKTGQSCFQPPMPDCRPGMNCAQVMPAPYCVDNPINGTPAPSKSPEPSVTVTKAPKPDSCVTDSDCPNNYSCFQPPMPDCRPGMNCAQVMPAPYCKLNTTAPTMTPTPTKRPTLTATPTPIACPVPDCKSGKLKQLPNEYGSCPVYVCIEPTNCQYNYSEWSSCNYGIQTRSITNSSTQLCKDAAPLLQRECTKGCTSDAQCATGEYCSLERQQTTGGSNGSSIVASGLCRIDNRLSTDLNGDGATNVLDLSIVIKNLFSQAAKADVNKDGIVDISDYSLVLKDIVSKFKAN